MPTRPCTCEKTECRLCWLFHNDERYTKLWSTTEDMINKEKQSQKISEIKANHPDIPPVAKVEESIITPNTRSLQRPQQKPCGCRNKS